MKLELTFRMDGSAERFNLEGTTWLELIDRVRRSMYIFALTHGEQLDKVVPAEESNND